MLVKITLFAALLLSIVVPFAYFLSGTKNKARYKLTIGTNAAAFFGIMLVACGFMFSGNAQAAEAAAETAQAAGGLSTGMGYLAAALVTGLSCIGGGIAVASAASAALGAISEDSSILGKSLIFVGLAEGVCLYGLVSDNVDTLVGMRLAGIEGCVVHEQGELKKAIDHALEDKEIGILLLTEKFGREYPELINKVKLDHKLPLIIEVPDRHGTGRKPDFITSYVNEAIGLKL